MNLAGMELQSSSLLLRVCWQNYLVLLKCIFSLFFWNLYTKKKNLTWRSQICKPIKKGVCPCRQQFVHLLQRSNTFLFSMSAITQSTSMESAALPPYALWDPQVVSCGLNRCDNTCSTMLRTLPPQLGPGRTERLSSPRNGGEKKKGRQGNLACE